MTDDRWGKIKEVFFAASALPAGDRPAFLNRVCGSDRDLRNLLEALLSESAQASQLESPFAFADLTGKTIGHYRIEERLGAGGMGIVYKAQDTLLGRPVALKFLAPHIMGGEEVKARFIHEARAAAAFNHPNICPLYGIEATNGQMFLVMAYVAGRTLKEAMPIPSVVEALRIAIETARGLEEAHRKGIVHRDIKPSNILLDADGRVLIADFGLALRDDQTRLTQSATPGTPAYMSPEQLRGQEADARSDIWSLGVVLYEMISGELPFGEPSLPALALAIDKGAYAPLTSKRADVPAALDQIIRNMIAVSPGDRYPTAGDMLADLVDLYGHLTHGLGLKPTTKRHYSITRRRSGLMWAASATVAVVLAAASYLLVRHDDAVEAPLEIPLSSYTGVEDGASFSPDGLQVAFSWLPEGENNSDICIKLWRDVNRLCVTSDPRPDILPAWSPDGRWIAFLRSVKPGRLALYLVAPLGGAERQLTEIETREGLEHLSRVAWTRDAKAIILSDRDTATGRFRLWQLRLDSLERKPLTSPLLNSQGDRNPAVSADGQMLAFIRETDIAGDLHIQPLTSGVPPDAPRRITFENRFAIDPVWAAGDEILYAAGAAVSKSDLRIWRVSVSGDGKPRVETMTGAGAYSPAISPDGRALAFTRYQSDQNIWRIDRQKTREGWSSPSRFDALSSSRDDGYACISPDGRRIAFVSNRAGEFDMWISNADGSKPWQRTFTGGLSGSLAWSPNGKFIAFDRNAGSNWDVYVIGVEGGDARPLTTDASDEYVAKWSADGTYVYVASNRTGTSQLWKVSAADGSAVQVTRNGGYWGFESADGRNLYYSVSRETGPIHRLSLETGEDAIVVDSSGPAQFFVTARGIYLVPESQKDFIGSEIHYLDFSSNRTTLIARTPRPISGDFTVSFNEDLILFTQRDRVGSDLVLLHFQ